MNEVWKPVKDCPFTEISNIGRVRSFRVDPKGRILKTKNKVNNAGYEGFSVQLRGENRRKDYSVHREVCKAFHGEPPKGYQVNHKNCNKRDNRACNLEWVSPKQNIQHMLRNGRHDAHKKNMSAMNRGIGNMKAKLTENQVIKIFLLKGKVDSITLGIKYNVHRGSITAIWRRSTWTHVTNKLI